MNPITKQERIAGAIYATAFGDAWGNLTEFSDHHTIIKSSPTFPQNAMITDDTQMSLYGIQTIQSILPLVDKLQAEPNNEDNRDAIRLAFARSFAIWLDDKDNFRAPGNACLKAMREFKAFDFGGAATTGLEGTQPNSKGCGANMRAMWLGLLPYNTETIANLAILQSETTHSHPLALSSAALTALAVKAVFDGEVTPSYEGGLTAWAVKTIKQFLSNGYGYGSWNPVFIEGLHMLLPVLVEGHRKLSNFANTSMNLDVCSFFGEGWIAEEALMNALAVADVYSEHATYGLQRLVYSSGDSDSIAAIGGAMLGTHTGNIFPPEWVNNLEPRYKTELADIIKFLEEVNG